MSYQDVTGYVCAALGIIFFLVYVLDCARGIERDIDFGKISVGMFLFASLFFLTGKN